VSQRLTPAMHQWVRDLTAVYGDIARTRMAGVPVMHPGLHVQAVGFLMREGACLGVLVTPWFMNLIWRDVDALFGPALAVGASREREVGALRMAFTGAFEDRLGAFECCSLISPMFQFGDQAAAVATAEAVMVELLAPRAVAPAEVAAAVQAAAPVLAAAGHRSADDLVADRRRFLFGRGRPTQP
jgi:[NiFe] hydrogenase assembly HybE family chaperone